MAYIGVQPTDTYLSIASQQITGNGGATYTLNYSVSDEESVAVFVNNVRQNVSSYTVSGDQLTLGGTISASDECWVLFLGRTVGTKTPAVGSVTNDMLAGSIANSKLANSSITLNGTAVSLGGSGTISVGITEADQWRLTANRTSTGTINSNLERIDSDGWGIIGTGMTESSGIFSFPSTGIWLIEMNILSDNLTTTNLYTTQDNSTYNIAFNVYSDSSIQSGNAKFLFDVTNTSTHKVYFSWGSGAGTLYGTTNHNQTHFTFIRLGDT